MGYSEEIKYRKEAIVKLKEILRYVCGNAKELAFYDDINRPLKEIKNLEMAIRTEIQNIFDYFQKNYDI